MRSGTVVFMIFPTLISQHPSSLPADCDSRTEAAHSRLEVLFKRQSSGRGPVCVCWRTDAHVLTLLLRPQLLLLGRSAPSRRGTTGRPGKHRVRWKHRESGRGSSLFGFCWSRWGRTESCCFYLKHPSLSLLSGPQQLTRAQPMGFIGHWVMDQSELRSCTEVMEAGRGGGGFC